MALAEAIGALDRNAAFPHSDGMQVFRHAVARYLAREFAKHNGWGGFTKVTTKEVRAVLIAYGASTFTIEQHARAIAVLIRSDFSEGRES